MKSIKPQKLSQIISLRLKSETWPQAFKNIAESKFLYLLIPQNVDMSQGLFYCILSVNVILYYLLFQPFSLIYFGLMSLPTNFIDYIKIVLRTEETSTYHLVKTLRCKLLDTGEQLPIFPYRVQGLNCRPQRWEASVLPTTSLSTLLNNNNIGG